MPYAALKVVIDSYHEAVEVDENPRILEGSIGQSE